jgi:hypothetical protein
MLQRLIWAFDAQIVRRSAGAQTRWALLVMRWWSEGPDSHLDLCRIRTCEMNLRKRVHNGGHPYRCCEERWTVLLSLPHQNGKFKLDLSDRCCKKIVDFASRSPVLKLQRSYWMSVGHSYIKSGYMTSSVCTAVSERAPTNFSKSCREC